MAGSTQFSDGAFDFPEDGVSFGGSAIRQDFRTFGTDGFAYTPSLSTEAERTSAGYNAVDVCPVKIGETGPEFIPAAGDFVWLLREEEATMAYSPELGTYLYKVYPTAGMNAYAAFMAKAAAAALPLGEDPGAAALKASEKALENFVLLGVCYQIQPAADLRNYRLTYWQEGSIPVIPLMTKELMKLQKEMIGEDAGFAVLQKTTRDQYYLGGQHRLLSSGAVAMTETDAQKFLIFSPSVQHTVWQAVPAFIPRDYFAPAIRVGAFVLEPTQVPRRISVQREKAYYDGSVPKPADAGDFDSPYVMFSLKTV